MIIDVHTHLDDETIYQSYIKKTKGKIDMAFTLHWIKNDLAKTAEFVANKPNLCLIAGVDIDGPEKTSQQIEIFEDLFKENKIIGLKLYPGYQYYYASDSRIDDFAKLCIKYQKPLVIHTGDVYDLDGEAILKYAQPIYVDELAMRFPDLKIVIAHFGFPYLLECANIVSKNKNVYTDISGTIIDDLPKREAMDLYHEYKKDLKRVFNYFPEIRNKVMFGTDYGGEETPLNEIQLYIRLVKEIFSGQEAEWVFSGLAKKLFLD